MNNNKDFEISVYGDSYVGKEINKRVSGFIQSNDVVKCNLSRLFTLYKQEFEKMSKCNLVFTKNNIDLLTWHFATGLSKFGYGEIDCDMAELFLNEIEDLVEYGEIDGEGHEVDHLLQVAKRMSDIQILAVIDACGRYDADKNNWEKNQNEKNEPDKYTYLPCKEYALLEVFSGEKL